MQNFLGIFSKSEVADMYEISVRTLNSWINEIPELTRTLDKYGYYKNQKIFTPKQVEIIFKFIGTPIKEENKPSKTFVEVPVRTYTKKETALLYKISRKTLTKIIENIEEISFLNNNHNKKYDFSEIETIFAYLGTPYREEK